MSKAYKINYIFFVKCNLFNLATLYGCLFARSRLPQGVRPRRKVVTALEPAFCKSVAVDPPKKSVVSDCLSVSVCVEIL
jgi:hypothetical protein